MFGPIRSWCRSRRLACIYYSRSRRPCLNAFTRSPQVSPKPVTAEQMAWNVRSAINVVFYQFVRLPRYIKRVREMAGVGSHRRGTGWRECATTSGHELARHAPDLVAAAAISTANLTALTVVKPCTCSRWLPAQVAAPQQGFASWRTARRSRMRRDAYPATIPATWLASSRPIAALLVRRRVALQTMC